MAPSLRTVNRLPLDALWNDKGEVLAVRNRWLSKAMLRELVRNCPVEFYVADVGKPLKRVDVTSCFEFWKSEVERHVVDDPATRFRPEEFPDGFAYIASAWSGEIQTPIVLLEKHH